MATEVDFDTRQKLVEARLQADSSEIERTFLTAAEVGDIDKVKEILEADLVGVEIVNLSGRTALELAVDCNNVEIVEYILPKCSKETVHRAMLCAVENDKNFIFEIILQHPMYSEVPTSTIEVAATEGDHSDKIYQGSSEHQIPDAKEPDVVTLLREALILAAIECNFPIVRTLVLKRAFIGRPHDYFCLCQPCNEQKTVDMMAYTKHRLNTYKALASPAYVSVTEKDPIIAAFQLSHLFKTLSEIEIEYKQTYLELDEQCQQFAIGLLAECRSSVEVSKILNGGTTEPSGDDDNDESDKEDDEILPMLKLAMRLEQKRVSKILNGGTTEPSGDDDNDESDKEDDEILPMLKLAMRLEQKRFVAHPSCQAQVAQLWFSGVPALRYLNRFSYLIASIPIGMVLVPILSIVYLVAPWSKASLIMNTPIMRFVSYTCSYITFLVAVMVAKLNFGMSMGEVGCDNSQTIQQVAFVVLMVWLCGLIWEESKQIYEQGGRDYFSSFWNVMDTIMLSLYMCTFMLELVAPWAMTKLYEHEYATSGEPGYCDDLREQHGVCDSPLREKQPNLVWEPTWVPDPTILSDMTFSIAVLMSIGRFSFIMPSNEQFGTMLVSFRRTMGDIFKLCSMFILVLLAFACGLAVLYGSEGCNNLHFNGLAQTSKTLIWAMFGMGDSEFTDVDHSDTPANVLRAAITSNVGSLLFGVFVFATAVVLMNLLIAMMANTFQEIQDDRDVEWKFGRTELWLNFIDPGSAVPPPFNIIPSTKNMVTCCVSVYNKYCSSTVKIETKRLEEFVKQPGYEGLENDSSNPESRLNVLSTLVRRYVRKTERERLEEDDDSMKDELLRRSLDRVTAKIEKRLDNVDTEITEVSKTVTGMQELQRFVVDELRKMVEQNADKTTAEDDTHV